METVLAVIIAGILGAFVTLLVIYALTYEDEES